MKSKMKKLLAILMAVCLVVPYLPSMNAKAVDKSIKEFVSVSNTTAAVDYGNQLYNGSKINSTMMNGATFVIHTKVMGTLEGKNGPQITYTGWGNGQEFYYSEFRRDSEDGEWWFRVESKQPNGSWPVEIDKTYLSESQCNKIKNEGLDLYLVKTGTSSYAIYMENADLTDVALVGTWNSRQSNTQVYSITHNKQELVTKGYFYEGYTAEEAVKALYEPIAVDTSNVSENVTVEGLAESYYIDDTMAFTVVANGEFVLQDVKINGTYLEAKEDGSYEYVVTSKDVEGLNVEITATKKTITEFASVTGSTNAVNFGNNAYNDSKINTTMVNGAKFVFHIRLKSTLKNANVSFTGYGSGYWEKAHVELRKDATGWYIQVESENQYQVWKPEVSPVYLSESQCNKIIGEGLDVYLVKTGTASYAIYMENTDLTDVALVGEWTSRAASPQLYEIKNNAADTITTGYFYQDYTAEELVDTLYTPITVDNANISEKVEVQGLNDSYRLSDTMKFTISANKGYAVKEVKVNDTVLSLQEDGTYQYLVTRADGANLEVAVTTIVQTIDEFVTVKNSTSAVDFGNNTYKDSKVNTTMVNGATFVFHTKLKSTLEKNVNVSFTGYGSGYWEKAHVELRKDDTGWFFQVESENQYQVWKTEIAPQYLSESQCNQIKGDGLDLYLVKIGTSSYAIYMENADLTDVVLVGEWSSRASSAQLYEVKNNAQDTVTTGYFYYGYSVEETIEELSKTVSVDATNISDKVEVQGLKESYRLSDTMKFNIILADEYALQQVKVNNKKLTAKADGSYEYLVTRADGESLEVVITTVQKDIDAFVTIADSTSAVNFGGDAYKDSKVNTTMVNGANFIFHTKLKSTLEKNANVSFTGYGSGYWEKFHAELRKDDTGWFFQVESENQYGKWYTEVTPVYLSESQCDKIKGEGLDLYLVKVGTSKYAICLENADLTDIMMAGEWSSRAASAQIYEVKNNSADTITNGYFYQGHTVEETLEILRSDISVEITTGEHVTLSLDKEVYHIGDKIILTPVTESGYAVSSLTVNGEAMTPNAKGAYDLTVALEHLEGIKISVKAGKAFEPFVTLTGASENQHGDKFNKFIYHTKIQSDELVVGEQYINVTYSAWGNNVIDGVCVRLNITSSESATVLLGNWCNGESKWYETKYTLDAKQLAKVLGNGLNLYFVHDGEASKLYEVYVETASSDAVVKICEMEVCHGDHIFKTTQTKKDGAKVTTIGYQYADFLSSSTAPTELFWVEENANSGDANDDGKISIEDIIRAKKYANNVTVDGINVRAGDMNQSRTLTEEDISGIRQKVMQNITDGIQLDYYDNLNVQTNTTNPALNSSLFYNNTRNVNTVYGADPSVMEITKTGDKNQGKFIMMVTGNSSDQTIPVYLGTDLVNWKSTGKITIVDENGEVAVEAVKSDIWAMEMIYDADANKYYLFFCATPDTDNPAIIQVPYVAVGDSYTGQFKLIAHSDYKYADGSALTSKAGSDALGYASYLKYGTFEPYQMGQALKRIGLVSNPTAKAFSAIDFHPFVASNGDKYLYFSITSATEGQVILGIQMADWKTPQYDTLTVLTKNKYSQVSGGYSLNYERNSVNEGPWMTERNGKFYLTMSINDYQHDNYKIIQAVADSPLGTFRKLTVEEGGILLGSDRIGEISGPGHHSLIEKDGEYFIIYHVHDDPTDPSYKRHIVTNQLEWVTNSDGLEVMYVNGPTLSSIQSLPGFASGYYNIASLATITATNLQSGSLLSGLTDRVWNSKGSTWKGSGSGTNTFFGDTIAKNVVFDGTTTISMKFAEAKTIRALMIYNSSSLENAFDEIEKVEFVCADGSKKYLNQLGFNFETNTYTLANYQGITTGTDKFICGASIAEFNEMNVKEIRITVKPGTGKTSVALGEIVVLGKK